MGSRPLVSRLDNRPLLIRQRFGRARTKPGDCPHIFKIASDYLITLYDDEELSTYATIRKFRIVQTEGNRQVARLVDPYRREVILTVGYRVRSQRGVLFRRWATRRLQGHPCQ